MAKQLLYALASTACISKAKESPPRPSNSGEAFGELLTVTKRHLKYRNHTREKN